MKQAIDNRSQDKPFAIVVLISGNGSNLQALIDTFSQAKSNITIKAVISNRADAFGLKRAEQANIATHTLAHGDYANRAEYDRALITLIDRYNPELVVLAGFMRILGPEFILNYQSRLLNIHPSRLPNYRGLNTHQRVIDAGETEHGASVHYVNNELDGGPLVLQACVPIKSNDTADTLAQRVLTMEHIIYPLAIQWIAKQRIKLENDTVYFDGQAQQHAIQYDQINPTPK